MNMGQNMNHTVGYCQALGNGEINDLHILCNQIELDHLCDWYLDICDEQTNTAIQNNLSPIHIQKPNNKPGLSSILT